MRVGLQEEAFANWWLKLGDERLPVKHDDPLHGCMPPECVLQHNEDRIQAIFGDVAAADFRSRVILTPTNDEALEINDLILKTLPGETRTYVSIDSVLSDDPEELGMYPMEFLNSITLSDMPPHMLHLKSGCIVMLLRNLSLKNGLCNGTKVVVCHMRDNVLDCELLAGIAASNRVLIPRIALAPNDTNLPFQIKRVQFPLRLSYALTVNKSQGQTFEKVGIYLRRRCFSHGQLFVAFLRARALRHVKVKVSVISPKHRHTFYRYAWQYQLCSVKVGNVDMCFVHGQCSKLLHRKFLQLTMIKLCVLSKIFARLPVILWIPKRFYTVLLQSVYLIHHLTCKRWM
ncbi:uncharacterized protein LOC130626027 [Hydractinia symbiolongicarpus]|uniref:uncharacterized protein LOC130626027 n=1 Tax=Hydractinia symbiolongicarpus TaxID=13093 RepID=UPI00254B1262|nr:uncharacterized protein LOC130626027 [Hydractinia symbiolongicarpus]